MANKFQKSIMERLEQEAVRQKQVKPKDKVTESVVNPVEQNALPREEKLEKTTSKAVDIQDYLVREPRRQAKNKTFYLDVDVINAVKTTSRQQNVNDSKLVNDILRYVLGLSVGNQFPD